jgi:hypothetical protein
MKRTGTIPVRVYAGHDYAQKKSVYFAQSMDDEMGGNNNEVFGGEFISSDGIFGGRQENKELITWAEGNHASLGDLASAIKKGGEEHSITSFHFFFDYPENFYVDTDESYNEEGGATIWHGRPLNPEERGGFIKEYVALCKTPVAG